MKPSIRTYREGQQLYGFRFFILNKGKNAGKPAYQPWQNCFVFETEDEHEAEMYYWLCYALWVGKKFYPYHRGSVIDFITLNDLQEILSIAAKTADQLGENFWAGVHMLHECEHAIASSMVRVTELQKVKRAICQVFSCI